MALTALTIAAVVAWVLHWPLWAELLLTSFAVGVAFVEATSAD